MATAQSITHPSKPTTAKKARVKEFKSIDKTINEVTDVLSNIARTMWKIDGLGVHEKVDTLGLAIDLHANPQMRKVVEWFTTADDEYDVAIVLGALIVAAKRTSRRRTKPSRD